MAIAPATEFYIENVRDIAYRGELRIIFRDAGVDRTLDLFITKGRFRVYAGVGRKVQIVEGVETSIRLRNLKTGSGIELTTVNSVEDEENILRGMKVTKHYPSEMMPEGNSDKVNIRYLDASGRTVRIENFVDSRLVGKQTDLLGRTWPLNLAATSLRLLTPQAETDFSPLVYDEI